MDKKIRDVFFGLPIRVRQSLIMLLAPDTDGFFVDVLGAKWIKAVEACPDINRLEKNVNKEKLRC